MVLWCSGATVPASRALLISVLVLAGCSSGPSAPDSASYVEGLSSARAVKDQDFRDSPVSPVPPDKRDALLPLQYFPIDPAYRVPAALKLTDNRPVVEMPTSTGAPRRMQL